MRIFHPPQKDVSVLFDQLTIVSYLGQREFLVPDLLKLLGNKKYACIYDPFSGSASLSFALMQIGLAKNFVINESLPIFECLWKFVKNHPDELISRYSSLVNQYFSESNKIKRLELYQELLRKYNENYRLGIMADATILFVFLINYSENYIPYFDKNMSMSTRPNVFINISEKPKILEQFEKKVRYLSELFRSNQTNFLSGRFEDSLGNVSSDDLVVMDPPYPQQTRDVFFTPDPKEILQGKIRTTMESLSASKVDFIIFYGSRRVKLQDQFNEDKYNLHHLVRLSNHPDFGVFLDHIYISRTVSITPEILPPGMAFYSSYFKRDEEMTESRYQEAVIDLSIQIQKSLPAHKVVAKL